MPVGADTWVSSVDFSGDGRRLALVGTGHNHAIVCDVRTGSKLAGPFQPAPDTGIVVYVALNADGTRLITGMYDSTFSLWNVTNGARLGSALPGRQAYFVQGGELVVGNGLWKAATGEPQPDTRRSETGSGTFSAWAAHASGLTLDGSRSGFRVRNLQGKTLTPVLRGPLRARVTNVAQFAGLSRYVLAPGEDHVARLWDLAGQSPTISSLSGRSTSAVYSPDGRLLVLSGGENSTRLLDTKDGLPVGPELPSPPLTWNARFSSDGRQIVAALSNRTAVIWDAATGKPVGGPWKQDSDIFQAFLDPARKLLFAVLGEYQNLSQGFRSCRVWDVETGRPLWQTEPYSRSFFTLSPNGQWLAKSAADGATQVFEARTGKPITPVMKHTYWTIHPTFSPDGTLLATCGGDARMRIWELPSGKERLSIVHPATLKSVAFAPDGQRLASGDSSGQLRVWDVITGVPLSPAMFHGDNDLVSVIFSPCGRWLLSCNNQGSVRAWDSATGEVLGPAWQGNGFTQAAFRPDGRQIVVQGAFVPAELWNFTEDGPDAEQWLSLAELQARCRLDSTNSVIALTPAEIQSAWQTLRHRAPELTSLSSAAARSWFHTETSRLLSEKATSEAMDLLARASAALPDDAGFRLRLAFDRKDLRVALHQLALTHLNAGKNQEALAVFDEAIGHDPSSAGVYNDRGLASQRLGNSTKAMADWTEALRLDPENKYALANRGNGWRNQGEFAKALADYQASLRIDPQFAYAFSERGRTWWLLGQFAKAEADFAKILETVPSDAAARVNLDSSRKMLTLEKRLPLILEGKIRLTPAESLETAKLCLLHKKFYRDGARLCREAFLMEPAPAEEMARQLRPHAVRVAVLAGTAPADSSLNVTEPEKRKLRQEAHAWLLTDVEKCARALEKVSAEKIFEIDFRLADFQGDARLAGVRDLKELAKLPEEEAKDWGKLWTDVNEIRKRIQALCTEGTLGGALSEKQLEQIHDWKMEAGKTLIIHMHSKEFDSLLKLYDPAGKLVAEHDDIDDDNKDARILFTAPAAGTYRIIATSFEARGRGAYTLTIRSLGSRKR